MELRWPSRGDVAFDLKQKVKELLHQIMSDEMLHAEAVGLGAFTWRQKIVQDIGVMFNGNRIQCDHLANSMYAFLETKWHERHPDVTPKQWLDNVRVIEPPTEKEIDEAWELEIAGDERAMQQHYEGSARTRKGSWLGSRTTRVH